MYMERILKIRHVYAWQIRPFWQDTLEIICKTNTRTNVWTTSWYTKTQKQINTLGENIKTSLSRVIIINSITGSSTIPIQSSTSPSLYFNTHLMQCTSSHQIASVENGTKIEWKSMYFSFVITCYRLYELSRVQVYLGTSCFRYNVFCA